MAKTLYKYNAETCQYERMTVKTPDVIFYISGLIVVALIMLTGMLMLHDVIFDSEKEIALRKENDALRKNHATLTEDLNHVESTLEQLDDNDRALHLKFFGTALDQERTRTTVDKNVLLADASAFRHNISELNKKSNALLYASMTTSQYYGEKLGVSRGAAGRVSSMPTGLPIENWETEKLVSGFGLRVNPFHKGIYDHPGVDIAATRDTKVLATANGTIINLKRSDLQAGYGNYVEIDHGNGFVTRYAHLDDIQVKIGQRVKKGAAIGTVGNSGGSVAPHLHYEIVRNGKEIDPVNFMLDGVTSREYTVLKAISEKQNQSLD